MPDLNEDSSPGGETAGRATLLAIPHRVGERRQLPQLPAARRPGWGVWDGYHLSRSTGVGEGQATENFEPLESLWWQAQCDGEAPSSDNTMIDKQRVSGLARSQAACDKLRRVREAWAA
jgi:hypothetical protein